MYRYNLHYSIYGYYVPGPTRLGKLWKPLLSTDTRGTRETREIVTSRTSPRTLLLHMPLTDLLRRIYRLADSRSGTLESPAGRFFDPRVEGVWQLLPLTLLFFICPCRSLVSRLPGIVLVCVVTHPAAVVQSLEHFAYAERSGVITHQRFWLASLTYSGTYRTAVPGTKSTIFSLLLFVFLLCYFTLRCFDWSLFYVALVELWYSIVRYFTLRYIRLVVSRHVVTWFPARRRRQINNYCIHEHEGRERAEILSRQKCKARTAVVGRGGK